MIDRKRSQILATAALQDIISQGSAIAASAVRDGGDARQQAIRADAHAHLDSYLDHMAATGVHTRALLED